MRVFVYGTLKFGLTNSHLLQDAKLIGEGWTIDCFKMWTVGFPIIRRSEDGLPVYGEVYEVNEAQLKALDRLEAEGVMYNREKVDVAYSEYFDGGADIEKDCFVYVGNSEYWDNKAPAPWTQTNGFGELVWTCG